MAKRKNNVAKKRVGRKPKDISAEVQAIICTLIRTGDSDRRVSKIVGLHPNTWKAFAKRDDSFCALIERATEGRHGSLASVIRESMITQIKKGHPWWAKLAIHNYRLLLKDPDVVGAAKIKQILEKSKDADSSRDLPMEKHPAAGRVKAPSGTTPPDDEPGAV